MAGPMTFLVQRNASSGQEDQVVGPIVTERFECEGEVDLRVLIAEMMRIYPCPGFSPMNKVWLSGSMIVGVSKVREGRGDIALFWNGDEALLSKDEEGNFVFWLNTVGDGNFKRIVTLLGQATLGWSHIDKDSWRRARVMVSELRRKQIGLRRV